MCSIGAISRAWPLSKVRNTFLFHEEEGLDLFCEVEARLDEALDVGGSD
jgi:hypothetical protein